MDASWKSEALISLSEADETLTEHLVGKSLLSQLSQEQCVIAEDLNKLVKYQH